MSSNGFRFQVGMSLASGLIWTTAALGDGPLFPGAQYTVGVEPRSVAIGDPNGDQVPDLAVANRGDYPRWDDNMMVLLNQRRTRGDIDGDGGVDARDFALFARYFNGSPPGSPRP